MTKSTIKINYNGNVLTYPSDTLYLDIASDLQKYYEHEIVLFIEDEELRELFRVPKDGAEIVPVTLGDPIGNKTYQRSMNLLLYRASPISREERSRRFFISPSAAGITIRSAAASPSIRNIWSA